MDQTTGSLGGRARTAEAPPAAGLAEAMIGYAKAAHAMAWTIEGARVMLELHRTLFDLGRDILRRQQDATIEAMLRGLNGSTAPDRAPVEAGFADLARLSVEAFDRIAMAMRAANDAVLEAAAQTSDVTDRKTTTR